MKQTALRCWKWNLLCNISMFHMFDKHITCTHHLCVMITVWDLHPNIKNIVTKCYLRVSKMLKILYTDYVVLARYLFSSVSYCPLVLDCMHVSCFRLTYKYKNLLKIKILIVKTSYWVLMLKVTALNTWQDKHHYYYFSYSRFVDASMCGSKKSLPDHR